MKEETIMRKIKYILISFLPFLFISCSSKTEVPHIREKITFRSGHFELVGELRIPKDGDKHPLVIMVHGDGRGTRHFFNTIKNCFLRADYGVFMWDKPGYGESTGKLSRDKRLAERASILVDAVRLLKKHVAIDSNRIGVWGISQAGYVMPLALHRIDDISFMIAVGCPGMNGIDQTAYLIRKQLQFEGFSEEEAKQTEKHFAELFTAKTYQEYLKHAKPLIETPLIRKMGFVSALWEEDDWKPHDVKGEGFFNPIRIIEQTTIPVLAFFGEKDTQVDPYQGTEAYKKALAKAGNLNFRVELIPNADHNIILCKTGSMKERRNRSSRDWQRYAPEYLEIMEEWLEQLSKLK